MNCTELLEELEKEIERDKSEGESIAVAGVVTTAKNELS